MANRSDTLAHRLDDGPAHYLGDEGSMQRAAPRPGFECDACGKWIEGEPGGAGLFVWTRGDEVRYEEPPLCESCASEITVGALLRSDTEEEEEG
jgi:hypothetical protein